jgi:hypothetical protein
VGLKLSKYEDQALLSLILAIVAALSIVLTIGLLFRNFNMETFYVSYSNQGMWLPAMAGSLMFALLVSAVGFFIGLNSAGQKRNKRNRMSWQGFFLNALVITVAMSAGIFFVFTRYSVST